MSPEEEAELRRRLTVAELSVKALRDERVFVHERNAALADSAAASSDLLQQACDVMRELVKRIQPSFLDAAPSDLEPPYQRAVRMIHAYGSRS